MTQVLKRDNGEARTFDRFLDAAICAAGVEPIPDRKVIAYMTAEQQKAPPSTRLGRLLDRWGCGGFPFDQLIQGTANFVWIVLAVAASVSLLASLIGLVVSVIPSAHYFTIAQWCTGAALVAKGIQWYVTYAYFLIRIGVGPARWKAYNVDSFGYVPSFVTERMRHIKSCVPEVTFVVLDLRQNTYSLDPIICAVLRDEWVAFGVWKNCQEVRLQ